MAAAAAYQLHAWRGSGVTGSHGGAEATPTTRSLAAGGDCGLPSSGEGAVGGARAGVAAEGSRRHPVCLQGGGAVEGPQLQPLLQHAQRGVGQQQGQKHCRGLGPGRGQQRAPQAPALPAAAARAPRPAPAPRNFTATSCKEDCNGIAPPLLQRYRASPACTAVLQGCGGDLGHHLDHGAAGGEEERGRRKLGAGGKEEGGRAARAGERGRARARSFRKRATDSWPAGAASCTTRRTGLLDAQLCRPCLGTAHLLGCRGSHHRPRLNRLLCFFSLVVC